MDSLWQFFLIAVAMGYLIGSVPFGLVLTRLAGLGDIRSIGSGNIGATNVLRTGHKTLALATLVLDTSKGAFALTVVDWGLGWSSGSGLIAGVAAVLGHNFPVWLKFKGGKGVATTLGVLLAAYWPVGVASCAAWLLVVGTLRYSSTAALAALACWQAFLGGGHGGADGGAVLRLLVGRQVGGGGRRLAGAPFHHSPPRQYPKAHAGRGTEDRRPLTFPRRRKRSKLYTIRRTTDISATGSSRFRRRFEDGNPELSPGLF